MKKLTLIGFAWLFSLAAIAQSNLITNIPNRKSVSLNGKWKYIVDPYETGFYDYRYKELNENNGNAYWNTDIPANKTELNEHFYADKNSIEELKQNDQILFRYCDEAGNYSDEANYNGSVEKIAGVCNKNRNVFGLMPHPERAADSLLANQDGLAIFESILSLANA